MASPPSPLLVAGLLKKDFSAASLKMICVGNLRIYKKRTAHASDKIYSIINLYWNTFNFIYLCVNKL